MPDRHALCQQIWPAEVLRQMEVKNSFTGYFRDQAEKQPDAVIDFYGCEMRYGELN
ncbi:hypothetical protein LJC71_04215 [Desulfosarcina sp. OttesenSCG-928-A07]|nr:hypothetical protein [Desulfosarcina sp. OttesenSCG-928-G17]MDL2328944.1 hypothetical protein [Desulfosarcina sp. OttesenSCG-928-A07]